MTVQIVIELIIAIAAMIFLHEAGHFIAARLFKIPVDEFGIGFPPRAVTLFEAGGTKFSLNWIPLGGFVRIRGELDPSVPDGLATAHPLKRIAVYCAGPLMNLLSAVILFTVIFARLGAPDPTRPDVVALHFVQPESPAAQAGLLEGDIVLKVNGVVIDQIDRVQEIVNAYQGEELIFEMQRGEQMYQTTIHPRQDAGDGRLPIGISYGSPVIKLGLVEAVPMGFYATYDYGRNLFSMLGKLFARSGEQEARLVGYKGMYDMYSNIRQNEDTAVLPGEIEVMGFFTSIAISLGLLNLLPVPALDGGRILLAFFELILRRRLSAEVETWLVAISFILMLAILIFVNLQDFINPIFSPG